MSSTATRRLVLVGGGHAHALLLLAWALQPAQRPPGVELVVVAPDTVSPYSGMVPGWLAGDWTYADLCIDVAALAAAAGARIIQAPLTRLDADACGLVLGDGSRLDFDAMSLNIGSTLRPPDWPGVQMLALRPLARLRDAWEALLPSLNDGTAAEPLAVTAVGGGAAGVEVLLAACATLRRRRPDRSLHPQLLTRGATLLPGMAPGAARRAEAALRRAGAALRLGTDAQTSPPERGLVLWAAGAQAHPVLQGSGLALDDAGFVRVGADLRSVSHPQVFAVGDCAAWPTGLPKAGVFAVRQTPVLSHNLAAVMAGGALKAYVPQRRYLALLDLSDGRAIAAWGPWAAEGAWARRWKQRIDFGFMARFRPR